MWQRPNLYGNAPQARPLVEATITEAELFGVVAERALTPLGRALLRGEELRSVAADLLPAPTTTATFLPDLTALVSGAPAAELAALLDTAADQESRDAASTWRFTPASVRRAFDTGRTADELLTALSAIADRPLPQPLSYLIRDVARRHGQLRVVAAGCCVVANDPALATELANHRQLANLRLRLLGDTVLASAQPAATVLAALRDAGYAPVHQNARGTTVIERHEPHRAPAAARSPRPIVDPPTLAAAVQRLRTAPPKAYDLERSRVHQDVAAHAEQLTAAEQRLLTDAIERHQPIVIQYVSAGGTHTTRVIEPEHLITPVLVAWCHLREAERHFLLSSITATAPVP
ncbi:MAG TPA: helicase-associated domain-containing protein [Pseudonocardiaceae bacterium]|nr:helicase-associated domain-containing protein [Pseudonocardiaceae bacterium]